ncbi:MAG: transcription antitermination factor NusB [Candidatus Schekmanbacteria bacterium RBG_16_38_11]|uniref:Transcription antitermination protein NusB n=2 Tax=Candidatus Schekmaniibacteriota TaxID=1817811 RepID=A0A1F7RNC3_9BACT|nr:MAG: transcription antitermination factor NusB [Candidatus Schekmanbacteria bacterium GWA2_38_11]OGL46843.1 MAG: transcription antitermination factor NusB [Candidatus Schekmanbacteria bacterium RBG_16_38_11]
MGLRRIAREIALQFLFNIDFSEKKITQEITNEKLNIFWKNFNPDFKNSGKEFAERLIKNTLENKSKIDSLLKKVSENWKLERMPPVDRNILRLGVSEFLYFNDIDFDVTINEAIEIAKKYGTEKSPSFINAVLDKVKSNLSKK